MLMLMVLCGCGALLRDRLRLLNNHCALPLGTLLGNLLVAVMVGYLSTTSILSPAVRAWLSFFLGGLGTYSTFNRELVALRQKPVLFHGYLFLTYVAGVVCVLLGRLLGVN